MRRKKNNTNKINPATTLLLAVMAGCLILILSTCSAPQPVDFARYRVSWNPENPFEIKVALDLLKPISSSINLGRPVLPMTDHRRGWIEFPEQQSRQITPDRWEISPGSEMIEYTYSFLTAGDESGEVFRSSRATTSCLFLQSVDLFVVPENITPSTRFEVEFDLPDDFDVHTSWVETNGKYLVDFSELSSAFIVAGCYRNRELTLTGKKVTMAINHSRPPSEDTLIETAITKTYQYLQQNLSPKTAYQIAIIIESIPGNISRAMRRGNSILIGIPDLQPFGENERKKVAHELVHLFGETEHGTASWFEEGVSEYLGWLTLTRTSQISDKAFFDAQALAVTRVQYSPYKDSLKEATKGAGGEDGRNYIYTLGFLGMYALDVQLRSLGLSKDLLGFLNELHRDSAGQPVSSGKLFRTLQVYGNSASYKLLKDIENGRLDIIRYIHLAGLNLNVKNYTLLEIRQGPDQEFQRILPDDTIISVDFQHLDKAGMRQYFASKSGQIVTVQIERNRKRLEQQHRVIENYIVEPQNYSLTSTWYQILHP